MIPKDFEQFNLPSIVKWAIKKGVLKYGKCEPLTVGGRAVNVEEWAFQACFARGHAYFKQLDLPSTGEQLTVSVNSRVTGYIGSKHFICIRLTRYSSQDKKPLPIK
jgi:hypothetical protein